jgi:hypothetical protein
MPRSGSVVEKVVLPAVASDATGISWYGSAGSPLYSRMSPGTVVDDSIAIGACRYSQCLSSPTCVVKLPGVLNFPVEIRIESQQVIVDDDATLTLIVRGNLAFRVCARSHEKCSNSYGRDAGCYF